MQPALVLSYVGLGLTGSILGPSLLILPAQISASVEQASGAVPMLFGGLLVGVPLAPVLARRLGLPGAAATAAAGQAAALLAIAASRSLGGLLAAAALLGLAFGISEVCAAALVPPGGGGGTGRALSLLTAVFAAAAVTTPLLVGVAVAAGGLAPAYVVGMAVHLAAALALTRLVVPPVDRPTGGDARWARLWPLALTLAAYVGAEATIATWAAELSRGLLALPASLASAGSSGFWLCLVLGRVLGARFLRQGDERRLLPALLAVAAGVSASATLTAAAGAPGGLVLALLLCVVAAIGPVYALALSQAMGSVAPSSRAAVTAGAIAVGAVGGIAAPLAAVPAAAAGPVPLLGLVTGSLAMAAAGAAAHRQCSCQL